MMHQAEDYRQRVEEFETKYFEPIDFNLKHTVESKWSYLKCDHSSRHFVVHRVSGYMPLKVVHFLMNLQTLQHTFYLTRYMGLSLCLCLEAVRAAYSY